MEPTEHTLPTTTEKISEPAAPERVDRSRAEIFTHDLDRINAAIIDMLQDETTDPAELREAWSVRADLAGDFINSLEPAPDNPNPKPRVWFDILVDKHLFLRRLAIRFDTLRS